MDVLLYCVASWTRNDLYFTEDLGTKLEPCARVNLAQEIELLHSTE